MLKLKFQSKSQLYATSLIACILFLRSFPRFFHPEIWAEDGVYFIENALASGWDSLTLLEAGYFHVLQRIIVISTTQLLPLELWPQTLHLFNIAVISLVAGKLASSNYDWILPGGKTRIWLLASIAFLPGLNEMVGNICNLPWFFFFYVLFLALKDPKTELTWTEIFLGTLCIYSSGALILALPALAYRTWLRRKEGNGKEIYLISMVLIEVIILRLRFVPPGDRGVVTFNELFKVVTRSASRSFLIQPWLGDTLGTYFSDSGWYDLFSTLTILVVLIIAGLVYLRKIRWQTGFAGFALAPVLLWPAMSILSRPGVKGIWLHSPHIEFFSHRYAFPVALAVFVFWVTLLKDKALLKLFLALTFAYSLHRFWIEPYGTEARWAKVPDMIKTTQSEKIRVPIYPDEWSFSFTIRK